MLFLKQIYIVLHTKDCGLGRISVSLLIPTYFPGKELTRLRYGAACKLERRAATEEPRLTRRKIPSKKTELIKSQQSVSLLLVSEPSDLNRGC